jgi:glucose/arabinose dehydrogenase
VAVAVAKDGALPVADDTGATIWRITCAGKNAPANERAGV